MAKYTAALSAQNTNVYLFTVHKPRNGSDCCTFTLGAYGTFGGGTVTVNVSPDSGTTLLPLAPINGSSPSITAAGAYTFKIGNGDKNNDAPQIFVAVGAATNPSLSIVAWDNN
jgi:hypothetical protein